MTHGPNYKCAALLATKDRWELLTQRALPSIRGQIFLPEIVVLVNDGCPFDDEQILKLCEILECIPLIILPNERSPGAAGAWNTGLGYLRQLAFDGYVAILDDDDEWDSDHLHLNMAKAMETEAELVVSGLRRVASGKVKPRKLPTGLKDTDFLCGNPGLQGSNTFVSLRALERARDFTEGLPSLNDRDLAVRLLRSTEKVAFTNQWTATWYHDADRKTLSSPRSKEKVIGLQWFWRKYSSEMDNNEQAAYLDRAWRCFGVTREEVEDNWGIGGIGVK